MSRARAWCFTLNNYTPEEEEVIQSTDCRYLIYGREVGEQGTPHLQGYIYYDEAKTMTSVKKKLSKRVHLEVAKGSVSDNVKYTSKDGNVFTKGDPPSQGKRVDVEQLVQSIKDGKKVDDIVLENPVAYHQYGRTMHKVEDLMLRKRFRTEMTEGLWIHGGTGVGKSHRAFEGFNPESHFVWKYDGGWQDGYVGQEVVIINEFRGQIPMCDLLMMVDKWPYELRRRGREPVPFLAKKVIVTSSLPPELVYHNMGQDKIEQLYRRFTVEEVFQSKPPEGQRSE